MFKLLALVRVVQWGVLPDSECGKAVLSQLLQFFQILLQSYYKQDLHEFILELIYCKLLQTEAN